MNLSTGYGIAISEIVSKLNELTSGRLNFLEVDPPMGVVLRSVLSCERLESIIPWRPRSFEESIEGLI